jgi:hypothetical protein
MDTKIFAANCASTPFSIRVYSCPFVVQLLRFRKLKSPCGRVSIKIINNSE